MSTRNANVPASIPNTTTAMIGVCVRVYTLANKRKNSPSDAIAYTARGSANSDPSNEVLIPSSAPIATTYRNQVVPLATKAEGNGAATSTSSYGIMRVRDADDATYKAVTKETAMPVAKGMDFSGCLASSPATALPSNPVGK